MKPSSQRALSFLISTVLLLGAVVVYGALIAPAYKTIEQLRSQTVLKSAELKQQDVAVKDLGDLLEKFHNRHCLSLSQFRPSML